jgi:hypothetical protein
MALNDIDLVAGGTGEGLRKAIKRILHRDRGEHADFAGRREADTQRKPNQRGDDLSEHAVWPSCVPRRPILCSSQAERQHARKHDRIANQRAPISIADDQNGEEAEGQRLSRALQAADGR